MRLFLILALILFFQISCGNKTSFQSLLSKTQDLNSLSESQDFEKESFYLNREKPKADILVVADPSGSMHHRLNQLGQSLSPLLSVISNYDWQIGITLADHGDHKNPKAMQKNWRDFITSQKNGRFGSLMPLENGYRLLNYKILTSRTPAYEKVFLHSLSHIPKLNCKRPPYCSNYLEQPLRSLQSAIKRSVLDNHDFFRPQADFISLIITNEDERKEDADRATSAQEVLNSFFKHFPDSKRFIAYNIIIKDTQCLQLERTKGGAAHIAASIADLARLTGGVNIDLCSQNYDSELRKISKHIKQKIENTIRLKKEPIPESIQVHFIEGPKLTWKLVGKDIVFENKSTVSSSIAVTYKEKRRFL